MNGSSYPVPYVLFGPPGGFSRQLLFIVSLNLKTFYILGTGKTRTLVAAIEQIIKTTTKNILVCAMTNPACDEIAERLLNILESDQIFRMYSKSHGPRNSNERLRSVSNFNGDKCTIPPLSELYKYRVIVCTLYTSGFLTKDDALSNFFNPLHFSYIFIDECASAHEIMSMIPIASKKCFFHFYVFLK